MEILCKIARAYPQSLYYTMLEYRFEYRRSSRSIKSVQQNKTHNSDGTASNTFNDQISMNNQSSESNPNNLKPTSDSNMSYRYAEEIIKVVQDHHPILMSETDKMLEEISRRFKSKPAEETYGVIHSLTLKCFHPPLI